MPSFADTAVLFVLALILFGPKKLPELARQLGKLMAEFRRASNEFKYQMEEELRQAEHAEQEKKQAAIEAEAKAANPELPAPIAVEGEVKMMPPESGLPVARGAATEEAAAEVVEESEPAMTPLVDAIPVEEEEIHSHLAGELGSLKTAPAEHEERHG